MQSANVSRVIYYNQEKDSLMAILPEESAATQIYAKLFANYSSQKYNHLDSITRIQTGEFILSYPLPEKKSCLLKVLSFSESASAALHIDTFHEELLSWNRTPITCSSDLIVGAFRNVRSSYLVYVRTAEGLICKVRKVCQKSSDLKSALTILALDLNPINMQLASVDTDDRVCITNISQNEIRSKVPVRTDGFMTPFYCFWKSSNRVSATQLYDNEIQILDIEKQRRAGSITVPSVTAAACPKVEPKYMITGSTRGLHIHDVRTNKTAQDSMLKYQYQYEMGEFVRNVECKDNDENQILVLTRKKLSIFDRRNLTFLSLSDTLLSSREITCALFTD